MTQATKNTLLKFKKEIKWGTETNLPFSQGYAIKTVIDTYSIPAKRWGYGGSLIGVETNKQMMFWRDKGGSLEFKGILNKDEPEPAKAAKPKKKAKK